MNETSTEDTSVNNCAFYPKLLATKIDDSTEGSILGNSQKIGNGEFEVIGIDAKELLKLESEAVKELEDLIEKISSHLLTAPDNIESIIESTIQDGKNIMVRQLLEFRIFCLHHLLDSSIIPLSLQDLNGFWDLISDSLDKFKNVCHQYDSLKNAQWPKDKIATFLGSKREKKSETSEKTNLLKIKTFILPTQNLNTQKLNKTN